MFCKLLKPRYFKAVVALVLHARFVQEYEVVLALVPAPAVRYGVRAKSGLRVLVQHDRQGGIPAFHEILHTSDHHLVPTKRTVHVEFFGAGPLIRAIRERLGYA